MHLSGGGITLPSFFVDAQSVTIPGIDLRDYYVLKVNPNQVEDVWYATATQGIYCRKYTVGSDTYYLAPATDDLEWLYLENEGYSPKYGFKSVVGSSGKSIKPGTTFCRIKVSDFKPGEIITVTTDEMSKIRTQTVTVKYINPKNASTDEFFLAINNVDEYGLNSTWRRDYNEYFKNGQFTYTIEPNTEHEVYAVKKGGYSIGVIDGEEKKDYYYYQTRGGDGQLWLYPSYFCNLRNKIDAGVKTHTIELYQDLPFDLVPLRIEVDNSRNKNGIQSREDLLDVIKNVYVDGTAVPAAEWKSESFKVRNGGSVQIEYNKAVSISNPSDSQVGFASYSNKLDGVKIGWQEPYYVNKTLQPAFTVKTYDPNKKFVFTADVYYNVPWKYTISVQDYANTTAWLNGVGYSYPDSNPREITNSAKAPVIHPLYKNDLTQQNPKVYTEVIVDGVTVPLDENGCYTPKKRGEKITIPAAKALTRNIPIQIYANLNGQSSAQIYLDPKQKFARTRVNLKQGWNTVNVAASDLPLGKNSSLGVMTKYGERNALSTSYSSGYYSFDGTENLTSGSKLKFYAGNSTPNYLYFTVNKEVTATFYEDGEVIPASTVKFYDGAQIKIVPSRKKDVVLYKTTGTYIQPDAEGNFNMTVNSSGGNYILRKADDVITINSPENMSICLENPVNDELVRLNGSGNETYTFPYDPVFDQSYSLRFYDPDETYLVKNVTSTPAGVTWDEATSTVSGIKKGMQLNVIAEANPNAQYYNIYVVPGQYDNVGDDSEYSVVILYNGPGSPQQLKTLKFGPNKVYLSSKNFPVKIGRYQDSYGQDFVDYSATLGVFKDGYHCFGGRLPNCINYIFNPEFTTGEYVVDEPQIIEGYIMPDLDPFARLQITKKTNVLKNYQYGIYPTTELLEWSTYSDPLIPVSPGGKLRLHFDTPTGGYSAQDIAARLVKSRTVSYGVEDPEKIVGTYYPDENGYVTVPLPTMDEGFSKNNYDCDETLHYELRLILNEIPICFQSEDGEILSNIGEITVGESSKVRGTPEYVPYYVYEVAGNSAVTLPLTNINKVKNGVLSYLTSVETESGKSVAFDSKTGVITGLGKEYTGSGDGDDPLLLTLKMSELTLDKDLTFIVDGSFDTNDLTLGKGTEFQNVISLKSNVTTTVQYNTAQTPMWLNMYSLGGTLLKRKYYTPNIYYNGTLVSEGATLSVIPTASQLPSIPENAVVRILSSKKEGTVSFNVEENMSVIISKDNEEVSPNESYTVAKGTVIKVRKTADEDRDLAVYRNGVKLTNDELENGFAVSNDQEVVRICENRNKVTFAAAGSTDLSKLEIMDNEGNVYEVSSTSPTLSLLPTVEQLYIVYKVDGKYISGVSCSPTTMKFNEGNSELSGLCNGTVTISTKDIVRNKEVNVYFDSYQIQDANILLGNGKPLATSQSIKGGNQTITFGEEDLPLIFTLPNSYLDENGNAPTDPTMLPTVQVDGKDIPYTPEKGGYVLPADAFANGKSPLIRIYPAVPTAYTISYMVEPGINFSAVPDGKEAEKLTEAGSAEYLSGTKVVLKATSQKSGEEVYISDNMGEITSGTSVEYSFDVNQSQSFKVQRRKVAIKLYSDTDWDNISVSGAGFHYEMYDAASELEFPQGTTQLSFRSSSDEKRVSGIVDKKTGANMTYDKTTGIVSGVTDGAEMTIQMSPLTREKTVRLFLEDNDELATTKLILSKDKAVEKEVTFRPGYRDVAYSDDDRPLTVKPTAPITLYLNNTKQTAGAEGDYTLPADMVENSVVKVYGNEQQPVKVTYEIDSEKFSVDVTHDGIRTVNTAQTHTELPGTEILIAVDKKTLAARVAAARKAKAKAANVNGDTEVNVNGNVIEADENDGMYHITLLPEHAAAGMKITVKVPDLIEGGVTYSGDGKTLISVDPNYSGDIVIREGVTTIKSNAFNGATGVSSVVVPNTVTTIEKNAFSGATNMENVILGTGVKTVASDAFTGCTSLNKVAYPEGLKNVTVPAEAVAVPYKGTGDNVTVENGCVIGVDPATKEKTLYFVSSPAEVDANGKFVIPAGVAAIAPNAFNKCDNIKTVEIGEDVKTISAGAFAGCGNITEVAFTGSTLPTIAAGSFDEKVAANAKVTVPDTKVETTSGTAVNVKVTPDLAGKAEPKVAVVGGTPDSNGNLSIPAEVTVNGKKLTVTEIAPDAFKGNAAVKKVTIPETVTEVGAGAFSGNANLTEVTVADGKTPVAFGADAFKDSKVTTVYQGRNTDGEPFKGTSTITNVTIGGNVTEIGAGEYAGCSAITDITFKGETVPKVDESGFEKSVSGNANVHVPADKEAEYKKNLGNAGFTSNNVEGTDLSVTVIDGIRYKVTENADGTQTVTITGGKPNAEGVLPIKTEVEIGGVKLPVVAIAPKAFDGVTGIKEIKFEGAGNPTIAEDSFDASTISSAKVTPAVATIEVSNGESLMETIQVTVTPDITGKTPSKVVVTGGAPDSEGNLVIPANVNLGGKPVAITEVAPKAFEGNTDIKSVTIPETVTEVGAGAFKGCTQINEISFEGEVPPTIATDTFEPSVSENAVVKVPEASKEAYDKKFENNFENIVGSDKEVVSVGGIRYEVETSANGTRTVKVIGGKPDANGVLTIMPEVTVNGETLPVTAIAPDAFSKENGNVTKVVIPETVTEIPTGAFTGCSSISEVEFKGTVPPAIAEGAFNKTVTENENVKVTVPEINVSSGGSNVIVKVTPDLGGKEQPTVTVEGGTPDSNGKIVIPSEVTVGNQKLPVTEIAPKAFENNKEVTSVTIPGTVTEVGEGAFSGNSNLTNVTISSGEGTINFGNDVFEGSNLKEVYQGRNTDGNPFAGQTTITGVTVGGNVTEIGAGEFAGSTGIKNIEFEGTTPPAVDSSAFDNTVKNNAQVRVPAEAEEEYKKEVGTDFKKPIEVEETIEGPQTVDGIKYEIVVKEDGSKSVKVVGGEPDTTGTLTIPAEVKIGNKTYPVTEIAPKSFEGNEEVKKVVIPETVTEIGEGAFSGNSNITEVEFKGETLPEIAQGSFDKSVAEKAKVTAPEIKIEVGNGETITVAVVPDLAGKEEPKVTVTGGTPDKEGNLTIPAEVTIKGEKVAVKEIAPEAFKGNGEIKKVTIPETVTEVGEGAFSENKNLKEVVIENGKDPIDFGENVFEGSNVEEVYQGRNTEGEPFSGNTELKNVTIGENVTEISKGEFAGSTGIKEITFKGTTPPEISEGGFDQTVVENKGVKVTTPSVEVEVGNGEKITVSVVPDLGGKENPKVTVTGGSPDKEGNLTIPSEVTVNGEKLPVTEIAPEAFKGNEEIKKVTIPETVTEVGEGAFSGNKNLTEVEIADGKEPIEFRENVFTGTNIEEVYQGRNTEGEPFSGNTDLKNVTIGGNVTEIGEGEFKGSSNITDITFEGTTPPSVSKDSFDKDVTDNANVKVPEENKEDYEKEVGDNFKKELEGVDVNTVTINGITYEVVTNRKGEKSVTVVGGKPDEKGTLTIPGEVEIHGVKLPVTEIAPEAFKGETGIKEVVFEGSVPPAIAKNSFEPEVAATAKVTVTETSIEVATGENTTETIKVTVTPDLAGKAKPVVTVTGGKADEEGNLNIPPQVTIDGQTLNVNKIAPEAFKGDNEVKKVIIPATVTEVGEGAFSGNSNLTQVVIAEGKAPISFGENVFTGTNIEEVYQGRDTEGEPFSGNKTITDLTIGGNVTEIGEGEFKGTDKITEITFEGEEPPTVEKGAFDEDVTNKATVKVPEENKEDYDKNLGTDFKDIEGVNTSSVTVNGITYEIVTNEKGEKSVKVTGCEPEATATGTLTIPAEVEIHGVKLPVTEIAPEAFKGVTEIKEVVFEGAVPPAIAENSFEKSVVENATVKVPATEVKVSNGDNLTETIIVTVTPDLSGKSEPTVTVEGGSPDKQGNMNIPAEVTINGEKLTVTKIAEEAFKGNSNITKVTIPGTVTEVGEGAFSGNKNLTEVLIADGKEPISFGEDVFAGTKVETVYQGRNTEGEPFAGNANIKEVTIGGTVTEIGAGEFKGCSEIEKINFETTTPPSVAGDSFDDEVSKNATVTVPEESVKEYDKEFKSEFSHIESTNTSIVTIDGIKYEIVTDKDGEKSVTVVGGKPDEKGTLTIPGELEIHGTKVPVTEIAPEAFKGVTDIKEVKFEGSVPPVIAENSFEKSVVENAKVTVPETEVKTEKGETLTVTVTPDLSGKEESKVSVTGTTVDPDGNITIPTEVTVGGKTLPVTEVTPDAIEGNRETKNVIVPEGVTVTVPDSMKEKVKVVEVPDDVELIFETKKDENGKDIINPATGEPEKTGVILGVKKDAEDKETPTVLVSVPKDLTEYEIPETVTEINKEAFKGCDELENIEIPEGVTKIGEGAFEGSGIKEVTVPNTVKEIGEGAFKGCDNLETLVIGGGVDPEKVGKDILPTGENSNLSKVVVPDSIKDKVITDEGEDPEKPTEPVKKITVVEYPKGTEIHVDPETGLITGQTPDAKENGKDKDDLLISVPNPDEKGDFTLPDGIDKINGNAFEGCDNITKVDGLDKVDEIGSGAFEGCSSLTEVKLPDGIKEIGAGTFEGCDNLEKVEIPESVTKIGENAFTGTSVKVVTLPETVTEIGAGAFEGCKELENVNIPANVESIGENAFKGCEKITEVEIPEKVTEIGAGSFEGCTSLTKVTIPEGVTTIGENAFAGTAIKEVVLPEGVAEIGAGAFENCENLTKVILPATSEIETIPENTFKGCTNLVEVTIPGSVTEIGAGAFEGCENLSSIGIPPTVEKVDADAFKGCTSLNDPDAKVVYPDNLEGIFPQGVGVSYPKDEAEIDEENGMIYTATEVYYVPSDAKEVTIPVGVETIGAKAFQGCDNLTEVTIPVTVENIGKDAFKGCTALKEVSIPNDVKTIEEGAFKGCTSLEEVNLGNGVRSIGEEAFSGCTSLKTVDIHSNVESIGTGAFKGCGIEELHLGTGIKTIGKDAFAGNEIKTVAISAQTAPKLEDGVLTGAENAKLYVQGAAAANVYKNAAGWSKYNPLQMTVAEQITTTSPKAIALSFDNNSVQLNATLLPEDATMGKIFWESSNPDHVRVDNTGKVTLVNGKRARSEADALVTITARTMYHNGPICEFTINDLTTGVTIVSEDGTVSFDELNGLIQVYTLDGKQMKLDGSRLEKGIYIIKMNGKTQKVNIQ